MVIVSYLKIRCLLVLSLCSLFSLSGCSISNSVGSVSDSSGSIAKSSESISDSSKSSSNGSEKEKKKTVDDKRYENEVQDFTVTYLRTNASHTDQNGFMEGISDVASQNGIVDWEANPKTYRAIGKGLKKAKVSGSQYELYKRKFANGDTGKMDDIQEGYDN